jgi:hypothetical protein
MPHLLKMGLGGILPRLAFGGQSKAIIFNNIVVGLAFAVFMLTNVTHKGFKPD